jgi:hypothetical protein
MEFLSVSILSGLIYDGIKSGTNICVEMLKERLQGWLIDEEQVKRLVDQLNEAGVNEDLNLNAIQRKIEGNQNLLDFINNIQALKNDTLINQTSTVGHNVTSSGGGNVTVGGIVMNRDSK